MRVSSVIYDAIEASSNRYNLDPALIAAVIQMESGFNPEAIGDAGKSFGLMQLHVQGAGAGHMPSELLRVEVNVDLGASYLRHNLDAFDGDLSLAISAHNQGTHGAQERGIINQGYVDGVLAAYQHFKVEGLECEPALEPSSPAGGWRRRRRRRRFKSHLTTGEEAATS